MVKFNKNNVFSQAILAFWGINLTKMKVFCEITKFAADLLLNDREELFEKKRTSWENGVLIEGLV